MLGLDWNTGKTFHQTIFGNENFGNGAYAILQYLDNSDLISNSIVGPIRISVTPTIIWENATNICQGIPLSYDQLYAFATNSTIHTSPGVPGTFYYNPNVGTVLSAGQHQPLNVTFIPSEQAAGYNTKASKTVYINVTQCPEKPGFFHESK